MVFKNSEEKRNTAWRTVMTVSSVLIVIIAAFFIVKLFTGNPLEGTWVSEDEGIRMEVRIVSKCFIYTEYYITLCE